MIDLTKKRLTALLCALSLSGSPLACGAEAIPLHLQGGAAPGFLRLPAETSGLRFTNRLSEESIAANRVLETGSGVAAGDFDQDGRVDLFFCGLGGDSKLFRNLGNLRFQDVTRESGLLGAGRICRGAVFADLDGDARPDLLVSATGQGVLCFRNLGHGRFEDATRRAGTASPFAAMTMALADVDRNGTIDLYVTHYRTNDARDAGQVQLESVGGRTVVPQALKNRFLMSEGKVLEYGEPDLLYLNDGQGRFTPVSWLGGRFQDEQGLALKHAPFDWGLSAAFRDLNGDGAPDLYVCNDYWTPDRIWINDGRGNFRALAAAAIRHTSASSMGVDFGDLDRDGQVDLFVVDMVARRRSQRLREMPSYTEAAPPPGEIFGRPQINGNTLFHNRGDGTFEEIAEFSGLFASGWSWQPLFMDVDLDGFLDVLVSSGHTKSIQDFDTNEAAKLNRPAWPKTNGMVLAEGKLIPFQQAFTRERMRQLRLYPDHSAPIFAFHNSGGLRFREQTAEWGLESRAIHHGAALADLDNDGDLDLAVNTLNSPSEVWINRGGAPRIAVELRGKPPNTAAVGAKVTLHGGAVPSQLEEVTLGGKYLSGSQTRLVFAPGARNADLRLEVAWPSGAQTVLRAVQPNQLYEIDESQESQE